MIKQHQGNGEKDILAIPGVTPGMARKDIG